jgi:cleavage and polyadenylation specificity factor subunit 1
MRLRKNISPMNSGTWPSLPALARTTKFSKASFNEEHKLANAESSVIMQCFTELTPPTAVTHSLSFPFLSADAVNLVVAKTSLLQIFKIKTVSVELDVSAGNGAQSTEDSNVSDRRINDDDGFESSFLVADSLMLRSERASNTKLILVAEFALSGTITSMVHVKTLQSKSGGESLLLGFKDAKLSLVEWDPERYGLSTVSIHYYEQEDIDGSPWAPRLSGCVNYLAVDPGNRCAALKFGVRNLAILPFKQGDEDTAMDDWDEELDGPRPIDKQVANLMNGDGTHEETPYTTSFVLRLSSLDPNLIHPIHLAFLYEYREPTFGILSSKVLPSSALLRERKDQLSYMVFTLDLQQRASTTILAVTGLPYDLFKVIPLPPPVGGVLLVGGNELIHIDQSGKANGVGVNPFAKQCTSFGLADQADIDLRLEGCMIEQLSLDNGEMLIILSTGELVILSFRMDGRSVSGLTVRRVAEEAGGLSFSARASTTSPLGRANLFVGSEDADSVILGWSRKSKEISRRRSSQIGLSSSVGTGFDASDEDDEEEDDDDDLYGDGDATLQKQSSFLARIDSTNTKSNDYFFRIHDSLPNFAPLKDITLSKPYRPSEDEREISGGITSDLELVSATGHGKSGALTVLKREIEPKVIGRFDFEEAQGVWTMIAKKPIAKALQSEQSKMNLDGEHGLEAQFDRLMIVSKAANNLSEESAVYALTSAGFEALSGTEFDPSAGGTIEAGTLGNGMRVIQVLKSEVRSYDGGEFLRSPFAYPACQREIPTEQKTLVGGFAVRYKYVLFSKSLFTTVSVTFTCSIASMEAFIMTNKLHLLPCYLSTAEPNVCTRIAADGAL